MALEPANLQEALRQAMERINAMEQQQLQHAAQLQQAAAAAQAAQGAAQQAQQQFQQAQQGAAAGAAGAVPAGGGQPTPGSLPGTSGDGGIASFANRYTPEAFMGEEVAWAEWSRVFRSWIGRFFQGRMHINLEIVEVLRDDSMKLADLNLEAASSDILAALEQQGRELYHVLIMFVRGKAQRLVLNAGEGEGFEAWRLLIRRFRPTSVATTVGRLIEVLGTSFEGSLADGLAELERRVVLWERDAGEVMSDSLKIGIVVKSMQAGSYREHLLLSAGRSRTWGAFVKEVEAIDLAMRNNLSGSAPMDLDSFQPGQFNGKCSFCGVQGHKQADCRKKAAAKKGGGGGHDGHHGAGAGGGKGAKGGGNKVCSFCGKTGHLVATCWKKDSSGGKGKGKGGSGGKGKGKGKGKSKGKFGGKGKGFCEVDGSTDGGWWADDGTWVQGEWWPDDSWSAWTWDQAAPPAGQAPVAGAPKLAELAELGGDFGLCALDSSQFFAHYMKSHSCHGYEEQQEFDRTISTISCMRVKQQQVCELPLESLGAGERDDRAHRALRFGVDTAACTTVVPSAHPAVRGYRTHVDARVGTLYSTAGKTTIADEGQKMLVESSKQGTSLIRSRVADVRRALLSVKDMTNNGHFVVFGPDCAFAHKPKTGRTTHFESTTTGWDHTVMVEPPNAANNIMNEMIATKSAERAEAHEALETQEPKWPSMPAVIEQALGVHTSRSGFHWPGARL